MEEHTIKRLLMLPKECEWAEFKLNFHTEEELGENISAISNGAFLQGESYGYILYGIDDETLSLVGTTFRPKHHKKGNEELENWLLQRISPRIDIDIIEGEYNGKQYALFKIPAANGQPTAFLHVDYVKVGSITRKLKDFPDKEKKIWTKKNQLPFEQRVALHVNSADDVVGLLDTQCYFDLIKMPYPKSQQGVIERLEIGKMIIVKGGGYDITNLGALLFAKDISRFEHLERKAVRVIQYKGKGRLETIKDQEGTFGYAVGFKGLVKYIMDILPSNEIIKDALRSNVAVFPEIAIRELVANALIHQDFEINGTGPMIEIFSDRLEISNPGCPLIKEDRFIDEHLSRNEKLATTMRHLGICEEKGSGMDKVVSYIELFQLPAYKVIVQEMHTKVVLYAYLPFAKMEKQDRIRACYQHACLRYVMNEKMTNTSLRDRFKITSTNASMVSRIIHDTIEANLIKEDNPDNTSKKFVKYVPHWA